MIRIMDTTFNLLGEIDDYENLVFTQRYETCGEFHLTISRDKKNTDMLRRGNIIFIDAYRAGIIDHWEPMYTQGDNDVETLNIMGYSLARILSFRVTEPLSGQDAWRMTGSAETIIKSLIDYNLGPGANKKERVIPEVTITLDLSRGKEVTWETDYRQLDEDVQKLCRQADIGITVYLDFQLKRFVVDVVEGKDLTANQHVYPPVIFSTDFDNLFEQKLTDSTMDYKNTAVVAGKGEGKERQIVTLNDDINGLTRREVFVNARDTAKGDDTRLKERGNEQLAETAPVFTLDGKINPVNTVVYGRDYHLGDQVTMRYDDIVLHTRITEVTETWDENGYSLACVFGNKAPDLVDKLQREIRSITV